MEMAVNGTPSTLPLVATMTLGNSPQAPCAARVLAEHAKTITVPEKTQVAMAASGTRNLRLIGATAASTTITTSLPQTCAATAEILPSLQT